MSRYFKIEDVCKVKGGKRIPQGETLQKEKNEHPYIRILDMYQGRVLNLNENILYVRERYLDKIGAYIVDEGDVILAIVGNTLGMVSVIGKTLDKANLTENCCKFANINTKKVLPLFLYYSLKAPLNQKQIEVFRVGSSQPKLPIYNINQLLIPKYSIDKQRRIIDILSAIDLKIENNNKINVELELMSKTFYDYWFLQFDFPDENGNPYKSSGGKMVWTDELKMEIPEGWKVKSLSDVGDLLMGQSPKSESYNDNGDGYPLINGAAELQDGKIYISKYTNMPTRICKKDDLIFCIRATIGNLQFAELEYCLGRGVAAFTPKCKEYSEYLYNVINNILDVYKKTLSGSIIVGITKDDLSDKLILWPPDEIIERFSNIVKSMMIKIRSNKNENKELESLRDYLLPLLMNGQVGFKE